MGDHFKVIDGQTNLGVNVYNVTHWECISGTPNAADLAVAYQSVIIPEMTPMQQTGLLHVHMEVINLDDLADYTSYTIAPAIAGEAGTNPLPAFMAWKFRLERNERGHHHGALRLSGVVEEMITGGVPDSGAVTLGLSLAGLLDTDLVGAGGAHYHIRIHRAANTIKPTYNNAEAFYAPSGVFFMGVSTQNSRKQ